MGRRGRRRAGGDEQAVEGQLAAVFECDHARLRVHRGGAAVEQRDALACEVVGAAAQQGAVFVDAAREQVGNGHARVGRLAFVADHRDGIGRRVLAQGLGGDDAGRPGTEDEVLHGGPPK
jgi:hypothetical protein